MTYLIIFTVLLIVLMLVMVKEISDANGRVDFLEGLVETFLDAEIAIAAERKIDADAFAAKHKQDITRIWDAINALQASAPNVKKTPATRKVK